MIHSTMRFTPSVTGSGVKVSSVMLGPATIGEKNRGRSREEGGGGVEEKEGEKRRRGRGR